MFTVFNRYHIKQDGILGSYRILKVYLQFLDLKQRFNWLHHELEKPCMISAKRLDVLYAINKDNFLLPLINMKRLGGNTLPTLWQETTKYTITSCRCKFRQLEREAGA